MLLLICCGVLSACTAVTIRRPDANLVINNVCIQENPKVWVGDFLPVLKDGFARHGIATNIYSGTVKPAGCEYVLSYTALQSWDIVLIFLMRMCGLKKMDGKSATPNTTSSEGAGFL